MLICNPSQRELKDEASEVTLLKVELTNHRRNIEVYKNLCIFI